MRPAYAAVVPVVLFGIACALPSLPGTGYDDWDDWESDRWDTWSESEWWETGWTESDTDTNEGDGTAIVYQLDTPQCDEDGWSYAVDLQGWSGGVEVWVRDTVASPTKGERHALQSFDKYEESGEQYEKLNLTLPVGEYESGVSTALGCDREDMLTWFFIVYDNEQERVDCGVIGNDPEFTGTVDEGDTEAVPDDCFSFE